MTNKDIQILAERHGLILSDMMKFNEMGIDFKVGFATDRDENQWLLRIPRRPGLGKQIAKEKRILQLVCKYLSVQVPDWKIATEELVAYPLLNGKPAIGISKELEKRYQKWMDNDALWPNFTKFIHGDLYAGHVLTDTNGNVCGIIDWSTAQISDVSQDFSGHFTVFGEENLKALISAYEKQGGKIWDKIFEQSVERAAAAPLAYGYFALETQDVAHINGAKVQLGVG